LLDHDLAALLDPIDDPFRCADPLGRLLLERVEHGDHACDLDSVDGAPGGTVEVRDDLKDARTADGFAFSGV